MITQERLKELLEYNKDTGVFTWKSTNSKKMKSGHVAGRPNAKGYIVIGIDYKVFRAHHLVWLYNYGFIPSMVDHVNGVRHDNRLINLRLCDANTNQHNRHKPNKNSSTGYLGVFKKDKKYQAKICVNGKTKSLGVYDSAEEASEVYQRAKTELHPFHIKMKDKQ